MYAIEKVKTNNLDPTGLPIWEVIVRDHHGHAVHHDCCYERDLDRMVSELQATFCDIPNPWCVKMQRRVGSEMIAQVFGSGMTKEEAVDLCNHYAWNCVDVDGFMWELYAEAEQWTVFMQSEGGTIYDFASGLTEKEALELCVQYDWKFMDENGFVWELYAEADRISAFEMQPLT